MDPSLIIFTQPTLFVRHAFLSPLMVWVIGVVEAVLAYVSIYDVGIDLLT